MPIPERPPRLPTKFWAAAEELVATSEIVIDRPKDSRHPQLPEVIYPVAYGYLRGTTAIDGEGIDVWVGSLEPVRITGVVCTFDLRKRDAEVKLLLGCTSEEENEILSFLNKGLMAAILVAKTDDTDRDRRRTPRGPTPAPDQEAR
jgi:inorganic pyrophosphatase